MTWLKSLLASPLKDLLPGKVRVWHVLVLAVVAGGLAAFFAMRNPGGRPFDESQPTTPSSPFADIDDPTSMLSAISSEFHADTHPTPVILHLARACEAVYASGETSVPRLFFDTRFDRVVPIGSGSHFAVVGLKDDIAVVVFRGTDEIEDWYANLSVRWVSVAHGRLHSGFWSAYQSLREAIVKELSSRDLKQVWVCGHSLGGAMALCCAYDLKSTTTIPLSGVVTFGQPKLADRSLAQHLNTVLGGKYLAVVADEDPVADAVPLCHFCGHSVWFDGDNVRLDRGHVEAMQTNPLVFGDGPPEEAREPYFQDVMSEEEFHRKQEFLRMEDNRLPPFPDEPPVYASSLPFFRDHNMSNYLAKLRTYFALNNRDRGR